MGSYLRGDIDGADRWFADAISFGVPAGQWLTTNSSLGYRSLIAGDLGRAVDQRSFARQAVDMADQRGINSMVGVARVALGVSLAAAGRLDEALTPLRQGATTMAARGQAPELANALLCLARVLGAAGDTAGMAATLAKARSALASCPDPGMVGDGLAALELPHPARTRHHRDELTDRELDVLRLLGGPDSESDIAKSLFVSFNTVHTQVRSIYRKLGVSCRADAVERARSLSIPELDFT